jgi:hypothetical protein
MPALEKSGKSGWRNPARPPGETFVTKDAVAAMHSKIALAQTAIYRWVTWEKFPARKWVCKVA